MVGKTPNTIKALLWKCFYCSKKEKENYFFLAFFAAGLAAGFLAAGLAAGFLVAIGRELKDTIPHFFIFFLQYKISETKLNCCF